MKKTLAILLSLALIICMIPGTAFAEAGATEPAAPISIEDAEVIFDKEAYTYTGSEIKPTSITLKLSDVSSVNAAATKFDIAYSDNITDVGTVTVTITAKAESGYTGTAEGTYEIKPLDLSDGSVEVTVGSQLETVTDNTFNWGNVTFYINKTLNTSLLKEGNLKVAVSTEENGTKKATFSSNSKDFITNEISAIFVTKPNIGDKVTAKVTSKHTYDGTEQNVTVSFTKIDSSDKTALPSASDYEIVYGGDRTSAGEQTITIIGKNNFAGAITDSIKYTIGKRDSSKVSIEPIPNQVAGARPLPVVTDTLDGEKVVLKNNTDYILSYSEVNNVVTVTIDFDANANGNYTGKETITYRVVDSEKMINSAHVTVNNSRGYSEYYTGSVQKPGIIVNLGDGKNDLTAGKDYNVTYSYEDSKGAVKTTTSPIQAADYTIIVTGIGSYGGQVVIEDMFTIRQYPFTTNYVTVTVTPGSTTASPKVTIKSLDGKISFESGTDYTVGTPVVSTLKGTATIKITSTGTGNLTDGSITETYAITTKSISSCIAEFAVGSKQTYQYSGSVIKPSIVVRDGYTSLVSGTDYTVTYKDANGNVVYSPKDAGTYQIVIEGKGMYSGTKTMTFYIQGTSIVNYTVTLQKSLATATGSAQNPVITSVKYGTTSSLTTSDYIVTFQDASGKEVTSVIYPGTYKVVVTGKNGYQGSTYALYTVKGLAQTMIIDKTSFKVYEDSDIFKINAKVTGDGTITYTSMNPAVATVSQAGVVTVHKVGRAVIKVQTTNNVKYDPVEDEVYVKVYPDKAKVSKKPWTDGKKGQMKVRWGYQDGVTKYQVRYATTSSFKSYKTKTVAAHGKDLSTQSTTIKNLTSGKTYYFKVRAVYETYNENGTKITYYGKWSNWRSAKTK